jgi:hypothetical protein
MNSQQGWKRQSFLAVTAPLAPKDTLHADGNSSRRAYLLVSLAKRHSASHSDTPPLIAHAKSISSVCVHLIKSLKLQKLLWFHNKGCFLMKSCHCLKILYTLNWYINETALCYLDKNIAPLRKNIKLWKIAYLLLELVGKIVAKIWYFFNMTPLYINWKEALEFC